MPSSPTHKKSKKEKREKKEKRSKSSKHAKHASHRSSSASSSLALVVSSASSARTSSSRAASNSLVPFKSPCHPPSSGPVVPFRGPAPKPTTDFEQLAKAYRFDSGSDGSGSDGSDGEGGGDGGEPAPPPGEEAGEGTWQSRMAREYSASLYKEQAIIDFAALISTLSSPAPSHRVGLRWRTRPEVLAGFGFSTCGNRRCPGLHPAAPSLPLPPDLEYGAGLTSFGFPFLHRQDGARKETWVEVRLCDGCSVAATVAGKKLRGEEALGRAVGILGEEGEEG
ncbi:hypothetical protein TeGR_g843 [Tetraparma gracilis]|uniref:Uncharacterized protein n=1 Tax=Tetraparma gracilis TaxID=2962635 RepID=A0ABQ6MWZ3_9STRA|nr:hypothetical protein TeGR_g843 [Tetraparma gracilis]